LTVVLVVGQLPLAPGRPAARLAAAGHQRHSPSSTPSMTCSRQDGSMPWLCTRRGSVASTRSRQGGQMPCVVLERGDLRGRLGGGAPYTGRAGGGRRPACARRLKGRVGV